MGTTPALNGLENFVILRKKTQKPKKKGPGYSPGDIQTGHSNEIHCLPHDSHSVR
jgi:hypothetical protein